MQTRVSKAQDKMRQAYGRTHGPTDVVQLRPDLPQDYRDFLTGVGGGTVGEMFFEVYAVPLGAADVYGSDLPPDLQNLLIIGDDYNGQSVALDPDTGWRVVEVDKRSKQLTFVADTFLDFIELDWRVDPSDEETAGTGSC